MDIYMKHAKLLGAYESWLSFAIEALKGKTRLTGIELAEYLENRIKEVNDEINAKINSNQYEHRNNSQGDTQTV